MASVAAPAGPVFSDQFHVNDINADGKHFDKVTRVHGKSTTFETRLTLDIASHIYPVATGDVISVVLVASLNVGSGAAGGGHGKDAAGGKAADADDASIWGAHPSVVAATRSLADQYDYVCHGRVYKVDDSRDSSISAYVSFGGLLLCLEGDQRHLQHVGLGDSLYLLIRK